MSERTGILEDTRLFLQILLCIPKAPHYICIQDIRETLGKKGISVSNRTLQRHLKAIIESGLFSIEVDTQNRPYGYRWKNNAPGLHLPGLTPQDGLLLLLAEEHLKTHLPASLIKNLSALFKDARNTLQAKDLVDAKKLHVIAPTLPLVVPKIDVKVFATITNALSLERFLKLKYRNTKGKLSEEDIFPLGLIQQEVRTYLIGMRAKDQSVILHVPLHRIEYAHMTLFPGERPSSFDLEEYARQALFSLQAGRKIRLTLHTEDPDLVTLLKESPLSTDQVMTPVHHSTGALAQWQINATLIENVQLNTWLSLHQDAITSVSKTLIADIA